MTPFPKSLKSAYLSELEKRGVPRSAIAHWLKWGRYYIDFCVKYGHSPRVQSSLDLFLEKLKSKRQGKDLRIQAEEAVEVLKDVLKRFPEPGKSPKTPVVPHVAEVIQPSEFKKDAERPLISDQTEDRTGWPAVFVSLDNAFATGQYALATRKSYRTWIRSFVGQVDPTPPHQVESEHAAAFLTYLAKERKVTASSQNQAFNALLFLFRKVLEKPFEPKGVIRPRRKRYVPTILTQDEILQVVDRLDEPYSLIVRLLYGSGLRLTECLNLRVQSFDFDVMRLTIHRGKGEKDRVVPLPQSLRDDLMIQLERCREVHEADLAVEEFAGAFAPERGSPLKWKKKMKLWPWQFFFSQPTLTLVPEEVAYRRYHVHPTKFGDALRKAVRKTKIHKRVTAHTFRHSFASHLLMANFDIKTIQEMLGHADVRTTMIYVQTVPTVTQKKKVSPLDLEIRSAIDHKEG